MLTLTQRNVTSEALAAEVQRVLDGWRLLRQRRELHRIAGAFRVLEVTRGQDGTWHPHIHALLWVQPSYFGAGYIRQARWRELWQQALGLDYLPVVEVHALMPRKRGDTLAAAAAEVGKYAVKDSDLLGDAQSDTVERVRVLHEALRGRRLVEWAGDLRRIARELRAENSEDGDLVHVGEEDHGPACAVCGTGLVERVYRWIARAQQYVQVG